MARVVFVHGSVGNGAELRSLTVIEPPAFGIATGRPSLGIPFNDALRGSS